MGGEYNKKNKEHNLKANKIWLTTLLTLSITVIIFIIILKVADIKIVKFDDSIKVTNESIKYIEDTINNYTFTFIENDKKDIVKFSDFEVYTEISNESKEKIEKSFIVNLENIEITFNIDALAGKIESLNKNRLENKYSSIKRGENYFVLEEEIIGNKLDTDNLYKELKSRLEMLCCLRKNTNINITINLYDYYVKFNNNNIRQSEYEKELSKIENTYIEYTNGYRIELKDLYEYLIVENDKIILDKNREKEYKEYIDKTIETELLEYDTVGIERNFKTTKGDTLKISGGTYGNIFDSNLETEYILSVFEDYNNETNRKPIYKREMSHIIDDSYIEVSIKDQHLWVYKDKELVLDSDVVTGTKGKHDTPLGIYYIAEMIDGKYLRGDNYVTWVNKWIRITNRGHGLHDATWRNRFGNNIYTYNGSHGCVNIPKKVAYELFEIAEIGMPVIIY